MNREEPNPASAKEQAEGSRDNVDVSAEGNRPDSRSAQGGDEFNPGMDLSGKTDSGPEPDIFGNEVPPQE